MEGPAGRDVGESQGGGSRSGAWVTYWCSPDVGRATPPVEEKEEAEVEEMGDGEEQAE